MIQWQDGALRLYVNGGSVLKGYDYVTGAWRDGSTRILPLCLASQQSGYGRVGVCFTDLSLGAGRWKWDFGDGTSPSTTPSPSHVFSAPGSNLVTLTVYGDSALATNLWVQVHPLPKLQILGVTNGICRLQVEAEAGSTHMLQRSTDLETWEPAGWVTNFSGTVEVEAEGTGSENGVFYRTELVQ
jgi:hypothetical protein